MKPGILICEAEQPVWESVSDDEPAAGSWKAGNNTASTSLSTDGERGGDIDFNFWRLHQKFLNCAFFYDFGK